MVKIGSNDSVGWLPRSSILRPNASQLNTFAGFVLLDVLEVTGELGGD